MDTRSDLPRNFARFWARYWSAPTTRSAAKIFATAFGPEPLPVTSNTASMRRSISSGRCSAIRPSQPRYVETLPAHGYRFVAPVARGPGRSGTCARRYLGWRNRCDPARQAPAMGGCRCRTAAGASCRYVLDGAPPFTCSAREGDSVSGDSTTGLLSRRRWRPPVVRLSPDGGRLAFTAKDASGAFRLFLRDFSELESRPVADGEGAYSVVWTPDGQTLLFTAKGKLRRIALNAAASQILTDAIPYFLPPSPLVRTACWSPITATQA